MAAAVRSILRLELLHSVNATLQGMEKAWGHVAILFSAVAVIFDPRPSIIVAVTTALTSVTQQLQRPH